MVDGQQAMIDRRWSAIRHPPSAIGHRPSAIRHRPSAIGHPPSAIGHPPSAICYLLLVVLLSACASPQPIDLQPETVRIAGSAGMGGMFTELAQAYQAHHPNVLVDVRGGGSNIALQQLTRGQIDLALISWKPEGAKIPEGVQAMPLARDALVIIVHPRNTVENLTLLQLRALYRGETLDWGALGGTGGEPMIISREDGSGARAAFDALVMGGDRVTFNALILPTSQAIVDYVGSHRDAVGYISTAELTETVRAVPVEDVAPTTAALRSGTYPLGRLLYLYALQPAPPATQGFLDFVQSPAGQTIIAHHVLPLR